MVWELTSPSQEWFYQIKGDMLLKIVENGDQFRDVVIEEGEMFLLPSMSPSFLDFFCTQCRSLPQSNGLVTEQTSDKTAGNVPHSPRRTGDTIGLVMERTRPAGSIDRLRWYCENKKSHGETPVIVREEQFHCENMETQLKVVIEDWMTNESSRTCKSCGVVAAAQ